MHTLYRTSAAGLACALWAACAPAAPAPVAPAAGAQSPPSLIVTDRDNGKSFTLPAGQTLELRLKTNPTAGYHLDLQLPAGSPLALAAPPAYTQDAAPPGLVGVGGVERFLLTARSRPGGAPAFPLQVWNVAPSGRRDVAGGFQVSVTVAPQGAVAMKQEYEAAGPDPATLDLLPDGTYLKQYVMSVGFNGSPHYEVESGTYVISGRRITFKTQQGVVSRAVYSAKRIWFPKALYRRR